MAASDFLPAMSDPETQRSPGKRFSCVTVPHGYLYPMKTESSPTPFPKARPSASADASKAAEVKRLRSMTVEQRVRESLDLKNRFKALLPKES
jgi:hypothetical protein